MLFHSISGVLTILVMIIVGYALAKKNWFDEKASRLISKLVTQVALPCYMLNTITSKFSKQQLIQIFPDLKFPIISMTILLLLSFPMEKLLKVKPGRRGLFKSMFANSNTVFVGLPVNMALFGKSSLPFVLIYYMANTTFFWTLGVYLIRTDSDTDKKFTFVSLLKKLLSPPLLGFMLGVVLVMLNIQVPDFLESDANYIGSLTIPLSMFFIGIKLADVGLTHIHFDKDMLGVFLGRFVFAPVIMFLLVYNAKVPDLMKEVFVIQAAMPVMTNAPVVAKLYDADSDYAAVMVASTTIFSLVMVPILMMIVTKIF